MVEWNSWSEWLKEGYYLSFKDDNITVYELVTARDFGHYVYNWPQSIPPLTESGPMVPDDLEVTMGYNSNTRKNYLHQVIFGIKGQVYIYVELPADTHRHGVPRIPKPSSNNRMVSHFEEWMSGYMEPTFITEHFMMKDMTSRIAFDAYNPEDVAITPRIRVMMAKLETERIGVYDPNVDDPARRLIPSSNRWTEALDKLYRGVIPHRPLTIQGVRAPAAVV